MALSLNPKVRFLANREVAKKHGERMADPDFHVAIEAALQHFTDMECRNSKKAKNSFHRIAGAREFALHLLNLSEVGIVPDKPAKQELNYRA